MCRHLSPLPAKKVGLHPRPALGSCPFSTGATIYIKILYYWMNTKAKDDANGRRCREGKGNTLPARVCLPCGKKHNPIYGWRDSVWLIRHHLSDWEGWALVAAHGLLTWKGKRIHVIKTLHKTPSAINTLCSWAHETSSQCWERGRLTSTEQVILSTWYFSLLCKKSLWRTVTWNKYSYIWGLFRAVHSWVHYHSGSKQKQWYT